MTNTELITFGGWTLRVRPSAAMNPRLLVLIHGWTGDENSMWVFARALPPQYWMIAPRAPYDAETSGFSWRPPQTETFGRIDLDAMRPPLGRLLRLIDEYSASVKVDSQQFDLAGFSQGAAVVNLLGMLYPHRVRKMAVLSGFVPLGLDELIAQKPLAGKNIFVAHGSQDDMVPIDRARVSIRSLEEAGAQVTYCEDEVGHKVSSACKRAFEDYLKD